MGGLAKKLFLVSAVIRLAGCRKERVCVFLWDLQGGVRRWVRSRAEGGSSVSG